MVKRMVRRSVLVVVAALCVAFGLFAPGTASASTGVSTWTCSKDGFTGTIWYSWARNSVTGHLSYIGIVQYKIDKGSNSGGNSANVTWYDQVVPIELYTGNGKQDKAYHELYRTTNAGRANYYRGNGAVFVEFIFDHGWLHSDPRCSGYPISASQ